MTPTEGRFFVQDWMTRATLMLGALQVAAAALLVFLRDVVGAGNMLPLLFAAGGALTLYVGWWTRRTPLVSVGDGGIVFRPALLAAPTEVRWPDIKAFAQLEPGWLVFLAPDGSETRMVVTALSQADQKALVAALHDRLTEVSYVGD